MGKIRYIDQSLSEMLLLSLLDIKNFVDLVYKDNVIYYPGDIAYFEGEKKICICVAQTNLKEGYSTKKWTDYQKTIGNLTPLDFTGKDLTKSTGITFDLTTGIRVQVLSYMNPPLSGENLLHGIFVDIYKHSSFYSNAKIIPNEGIYTIGDDNWQDLSLNTTPLLKSFLKPNSPYLLKVKVTKNTLNGGYIVINDKVDDGETGISDTKCRIESSSGVGDFYFKIITTSNPTDATKLLKTTLSNRSISGEIQFSLELYELDVTTEVEEKMSATIYADSLLEDPNQIKGTYCISGLYYKNDNLLDDIVKGRNTLTIYLKNGYKYKIISSGLFTTTDEKPLTNNIKLASGTSMYDLTSNSTFSKKNYIPSEISDALRYGNISGLVQLMKSKYEDFSSNDASGDLQDLGNFREVVDPTNRINQIKSQTSTIEAAKNIIDESKIANEELLTRKKLKLLEKYNEIK